MIMNVIENLNTYDQKTDAVVETLINELLDSVAWPWPTERPAFLPTLVKETTCEKLIYLCYIYNYYKKE